MPQHPPSCSGLFVAATSNYLRARREACRAALQVVPAEEDALADFLRALKKNHASTAAANSPANAGVAKRPRASVRR